MKLRNVDLRGRRNHRIQEHGKDKPQNEKQGLHITKGIPAFAFTTMRGFRVKQPITRAIFLWRYRSADFKTRCTANFQMGKLLE